MVEGGEGGGTALINFGEGRCGCKGEGGVSNT